MQCHKEKAAHSDVFDNKKKSNNRLAMPKSYLSQAGLTTFAFCSGDIKKLLLELYPYSGLGLGARQTYCSGKVSKKP